jgi:RHH-type proline utilization regulon transcriptional repressor/proline dehydrogenase/delta 1-pyrroline-5-carboxylate dehydrogenase
MADKVHAGNIYANRNQIGAIVGSQPFGGEGLSGTGPKAGGPNYLPRFTRRSIPRHNVEPEKAADPKRIAAALTAPAMRAAIRSRHMPGPTGELNRLFAHPRPPVLCLGPGASAASEQVAAVEALGGRAVAVEGRLAPEALIDLPPFGAVVWWGDKATARGYAQALARREGPIIALCTGRPDVGHTQFERHLCVDTTAAGGNASLLAGG